MHAQSATEDICLFCASADVLPKEREKELLNKPFRPQNKRNTPSFLPSFLNHY